MKDQIKSSIALGVTYCAAAAAAAAPQAAAAAANRTVGEAKKAFLGALSGVYAAVTDGDPDRLPSGLAAIAGILRDAREAAELTVAPDTVRKAFSRLSGQLVIPDGAVEWTWGRGGPRPGGRLPFPAVTLAAPVDPYARIEKLLPELPDDQILLLGQLMDRALERMHAARATADLWEEIREAHTEAAAVAEAADKRIEVMAAA